MLSRPWLKALPPVLVVQLKRFEYSASGESTKLADAIPFPLHSLDMSPYVLPRGAAGAGASSPTSKFVAVLGRLVSPRSSSAAAAAKAVSGGAVAAGPGAGAGAGAVSSAAATAAGGGGLGASAGTGGVGALQRDDGGSLYDLFGIVCHVGNSERGHYTAFSRSLGSGSDWHYYDDAVVSPVREDEVASERVASLAYVLFYARRRAGAKAPQQSAVAQARERAWRLAHPLAAPPPGGSSGATSSLAALVGGGGAGGSGAGAAGTAAREAERERSAASDHAIALALASGQMLV